ncbi:MAG: Trk family potassium uptake protein [Paludibacter sp.]|nr:Trk family potassium uptake protein [Paludibacter sp.]
MMSIKLKLSYTQIITLVFLVLIIFGGLLLCLPVSAKNGEWTPFINAIFTSTASLCVTGLVVYDTWTHWSLFGQVLILLLIQTGGIGIMTILTIFSVFLKRKIGLHERQLLAQSTGLMSLSGIIRLIIRIVTIIFTIELIGAIILSLRFCPQMGFVKGLWNGVFHSVSAFCNAGIDLMGKYGKFSSLTTYAGDTTVCLTIALLIVLGGIGFVVLDDIIIHKFKFKNYTLNSKIALSVSGILILVGWLLFYVFETNGVLKNLPTSEKIIAALFQSITPRTAGFDTVHFTNLAEASVLLSLVLMFIGGSSGSTAGGIKTSTLAILFLSTLNSFRKTRSMIAFRRKLDDKTAKRAAAIVSIYMIAIISATLILCATEPFSMKEALFESVSAISTVGLTLGITTSLSIVGKIVIMILIFAGRVGWITLLLALAKKRIDPPIDRPMEKILIG